MEGPLGPDVGIASLVSLPADFETLHFFYGNEETGGRPVGPCSWEVLRGLWAKGDISLETLIWCKGMKRQEAISAVEDLPALLAAAESEPAHMDKHDSRQESDGEVAQAAQENQPEAGGQLKLQFEKERQTATPKMSAPPPGKILHAGSLGGSESRLLREGRRSHALPTGSSTNLAALEENQQAAAEGASAGSRSERLESLETEVAEMKRLLRRSSVESNGSAKKAPSSGRQSLPGQEGCQEEQGQTGASTGALEAAALPPAPSNKIKRRAKKSIELGRGVVHAGSVGGEEGVETRALYAGSLGGQLPDAGQTGAIVVAVEEPITGGEESQPTDITEEMVPPARSQRSKRAKGEKPKRKKRAGTAKMDGGFEVNPLEAQGVAMVDVEGPALETQVPMAKRTSSRRSSVEGQLSKRSSQSSVTAPEYGALEDGAPPREQDDAKAEENGAEEDKSLDLDEVLELGDNEGAVRRMSRASDGGEEEPAVVEGSFSPDGTLEVKAAGRSGAGGRSSSVSNEVELVGGPLSRKSSTGSVGQGAPLTSRESIGDGRASVVAGGTKKAQGVFTRARQSSMDAEERSGRASRRGSTYSELAGRRKGRKYILDSASEDSSDAESVNQEAPHGMGGLKGDKNAGESGTTTPSEQSRNSEANALAAKQLQEERAGQKQAPGQDDVSDEEESDAEQSPSARVPAPLPFLGTYFRGLGPFAKPTKAAKASQTVGSGLAEAPTAAHYSSLAGAHSGQLPDSPNALSAENSFREALSKVVAENAELRGGKEEECEQGEQTPSEAGSAVAEGVLAEEYLAGLTRAELEAKCVRLAKKVRALRQEKEELSGLLLLRRRQSVGVEPDPLSELDRVAALVSLAQRFSVARELISPRPGSKTAEMSKVRELEVRLAQLAELLEGAAQELQAAEQKQTKVAGGIAASPQADSGLGSQSRRRSSHEPRLAIAKAEGLLHVGTTREDSIDAPSSSGTPSAPPAEKRTLSPAQLADLLAYKSLSPRTAPREDTERPLLRSMSAEMRQRAQAKKMDHLVRALHDAYRAQTGRKLPLVKVEGGVYRLAGRKVHLAVANERLCLKAGGGLQDFADYLGRTTIRTAP
ncbi:hypothetical protein KFL_002090110 [Klebsormidium nitens]|uniref:GYF domain-containing protein n=1 Tax=Klebsormidium nitens TaxID=105231 RepID=A0A1Y1I622_KLENI|nr:hypothetical protein KFL_002090110 [Klebsormidium nitens]|eukprot:GAQ84859.1 hypothetical protein KFL_002090110 [Klebsormidium nitens]